MCCIPPLNLTSSSPWCHWMSPQSGDISGDPVAPSEGHSGAGSIAATCVTYIPGSGSSPHSTAEGIECSVIWRTGKHGIHGQGPTTHGSPAATDKRARCAAWALWCSPCPGTSGDYICSHLSPSWVTFREVAQVAGAEVKRLHESQLTLHLSTWCLFAKAVAGCESYLVKGLTVIMPCGPNSVLALSNSLFRHRWPRESSVRCFQRKLPDSASRKVIERWKQALGAKTEITGWSQAPKERP